MKTFFKINTSTFSDQEGKVIETFGIDAVSEDGKIQNSVTDAFESRKKAEELAKICTKYELAPEHLKDVIEDAMV